MDRQVCMRSDYFLIFVVITIGIIIWVLTRFNNQYQQMVLKLRDMVSEMNTKLSEPPTPSPPSLQSPQSPPSEPPSQSDLPQGTVYQLQRTRDFQRLVDPLIPPIQRGFFPPTVRTQLPFNLATQGDYGNFQQVGYVVSPKDGNQMFRLMGRQLDSYRYEYYVIHPYTEIKIPITVKNDWELHTDDQVEIPGFKGHYRVQIYDIDRPRYIPY